MGPVLSGAEVFNSVRAARLVVTVGDACTLDLVERGRMPDVAIVDFKTKREERRDYRAKLARVGEKVLCVSNPAASLKHEVWRALDEAFKSGERVRVEVQGEEDLTALAAIALAPEGTAVLYGMPNEGVVLVRVDKAARAAVHDLLARMV